MRYAHFAAFYVTTLVAAFIVAEDKVDRSTSLIDTNVIIRRTFSYFMPESEGLSVTKDFLNEGSFFVTGKSGVRLPVSFTGVSFRNFGTFVLNAVDSDASATFSIAPDGSFLNLDTMILAASDPADDTFFKISGETAWRSTGSLVLIKEGGAPGEATIGTELGQPSINSGRICLYNINLQHTSRLIGYGCIGVYRGSVFQSNGRLLPDLGQIIVLSEPSATLEVTVPLKVERLPAIVYKIGAFGNGAIIKTQPFWTSANYVAGFIRLIYRAHVAVSFLIGPDYETRKFTFDKRKGEISYSGPPPNGADCACHANLPEPPNIPEPSSSSSEESSSIATSSSFPYSSAFSSAYSVSDAYSKSDVQSISDADSISDAQSSAISPVSDVSSGFSSDSLLSSLSYESSDSTFTDSDHVVTSISQQSAFTSMHDSEHPSYADEGYIFPFTGSWEWEHDPVSTSEFDSHVTSDSSEDAALTSNESHTSTYDSSISHAFASESDEVVSSRITDSVPFSSDASTSIPSDRSAIYHSDMFMSSELSHESGESGDIEQSTGSVEDASCTTTIVDVETVTNNQTKTVTTGSTFITIDFVTVTSDRIAIVTADCDADDLGCLTVTSSQTTTLTNEITDVTTKDRNITAKITDTKIRDHTITIDDDCETD